MSDLKTCPFCGSKAESFSDVSFCAEDGRKIAEIKWFVWCTECSALVSGESKEEASEAWNRRATAQPEIIRCKDCKHSFLHNNGERISRICGRTKMCGTTKDNWFCADAERRTDG